MNAHTWGKGNRRRIDVRKVPVEVLELVEERQGGKLCAICRSTDRLELDHRVALAAGGDNHHRNLQWLCRPCNRRKGKRRFPRMSIAERARRLEC